MRFTVLLACALAMSAFCACPGSAKPGHKPSKLPAVTPQSAAQQAAKSWLALLDAGNYNATWAAMPAMVRAQVSREQWAGSVRQARGPLGALQARVVQQAQYTAALPGAPAGEYVIIAYRSKFATGGAQIETVPMFKDTDGKWKAAGYFLKPKA